MKKIKVKVLKNNIHRFTSCVNKNSKEVFKKKYSLLKQKSKTKKNANSTHHTIYEKLKLLDTNFKKCVIGYHLFNSSVINETMWENINTLIFLSSGIKIYSTSDGSHSPGMDIDSSLGRISNKSAKYSNNKKCVDISSYRLTTVCSEKNYGIPVEIIEEINRRKNFDYYSLIVRNEDNIHIDNISYDWLLIPSGYKSLDPSSYIWEPKLGKRGKNKDTQIGWITNEINGCKMSITFSMSSQLWIHIEMRDEIKKFIVASIAVQNKPKYNYIDILKKIM